jgi:protein-tyrosine phosphatase
METPHPRTYWVQEAKFLAGSYPGSPDLEFAVQHLAKLLSAGIRCFIDLTNDREIDRSEHYEPVLRQIAKDTGIPLSYHHYPIEDLYQSSYETMQAIMECIDHSICIEGAPVYVHCRLGIGRTGMVVGCWLIRHRYATAENVLSLIAELRKNEPTGHIRSPETYTQIEFVKSWKPLPR